MSAQQAPTTGINHTRAVLGLTPKGINRWQQCNSTT